jgi:hypothetical protein
MTKHSINSRKSEAVAREKLRTAENNTQEICLNCESFRQTSGRCYKTDGWPVDAYYTNTCDDFERVDFIH